MTVACTINDICGDQLVQKATKTADRLESRRERVYGSLDIPPIYVYSWAAAVILWRIWREKLMFVRYDAPGLKTLRVAIFGRAQAIDHPGERHHEDN